MRELVEALARLREFRHHPLGFFYIHRQMQTHLALRVHVWLTSGVKRQTSDHHTHSYDIESLVVSGKIANEIFRFRTSQGGEALEYAVSYGETSSYLQANGRRGELDRVMSLEVSAGERYRINAGTIHCVKAVSTPSVTVVRTFDRNQPIYSYGSSEEALMFKRRLANGAERRRIAAILEEALLN